MSVFAHLKILFVLIAMILLPQIAHAADKWVNLSFAPAWKNYGRNFQPVSAVKTGKIVTVTGLAEHSGSGKWAHIATLPADMRPTKRLIFNTNTHELNARVDVLPNGQIHFIEGNKNHKWVSMDGISFSLDKRYALKLAPGWQNYGGGYMEVNTVRADDTVIVSGLVKPGKGETIATLPPHLRPVKRLIFNLNSDDKTSRVDVMPDGQIIWVYRAPARTWVSLSGITFQRKPGNPLKLASGWRKYKNPDLAVPNVSKIGNRVTVSGIAQGNNWGHLATLPNGMCPSEKLIFNLSNHDASSRVDVTSDCKIQWIAGGRDHGWVNFDGISFVLNSSSKKVAATPAAMPTAKAVSMPWVTIPGHATDISVGANGAAWIIGANKKNGGFDIWRYAALNKWTSIPGGGQRIAVAPNGNAWIVTDKGKIQFWDGKKWHPVTGSAADIGIGANNEIWIAGTKGAAWQWTGSKWAKKGGKGISRIAVDPKKGIWAVTNTSEIMRYDGNTWKKFPGTGIDISISTKGHVWIVGTDQSPYWWTRGKWVKYSGTLNNISADPTGYAWGVDAGKKIWADKRSPVYTKVPKPIVQSATLSPTASTGGGLTSNSTGGGAGSTGSASAEESKQIESVKTELLKNPTFKNVALTDTSVKNGVLTAKVKFRSVNARLISWRTATNKPFISATVVDKISIKKLLPKVTPQNKLLNYDLENVVIFTVPTGAQNLAQKIKDLPKAVADAAKASDPSLNNNDVISLAPGMTYLGGLKITGFVGQAMDKMGLSQPVSLNGSLALTNYTAPESTVTLTARFKQDPLAIVMGAAPIKVIKPAPDAKPQLYLTASGALDFEIGYSSQFEAFDEIFDGKLSFAKSGTGVDAASTVAIEMTKPGEWKEPYFLAPDLKVMHVRLYDTAVRFERQLANAGASDTLSIETSKTKIKNKDYSPAAFTFTIDSTSAYPKAAFVNLGTNKMTIVDVVELAQVANQMSPQGRIAELGMGASPYSSGDIFRKLRLDQLPLDEISINNPLIYFATAGAKVPDILKTVSPPLPDIIGAGVHVRGKLVTFRRTLVDSEVQLDFKGLKTDAEFAALPFVGFTLKDVRFALDATPGSNASASYSGKTTIHGFEIASTNITIGKNNFGFDLESACLQFVQLAISGRTRGFQFNIPIPAPRSCGPDPLEVLKDALKAGQKVAELGASVVTRISTDAWHGLRGAAGAGKISPTVITNVIREYGNPANAAQKLAAKGEEVVNAISNQINSFLKKKKKNHPKPIYKNEPSDCLPLFHDWSLEYASCWRKGHEMIRLAADPTLCISTRNRIREKGKGVELSKCEGGWHQQWKLYGNGIRDGLANAYCWEQDRDNRSLESRPCEPKELQQRFRRDQFDRILVLHPPSVWAIFEKTCLEVEQKLDAKSAKMLGVSGYQDGADIQMAPCLPNEPRQKWIFETAHSFEK